MLPEVGQFALALALSVAIVQGVLPLAGVTNGSVPWMRLARHAAWAQMLLLVISFACLMAAFIGHDFSVEYVARNSNLTLPLEYRISAVWGGHEGSLLLWVLILSLWTVAVAVFSRHLPLAVAARVLGVLGLVSAGFLGFMVFTSNPFTRLIPAPGDGGGLNPLLQDPGMIFHPPLLYAGYMGFTVAFAFAVAALLGGRLDAAWARWSRPWTTSAWIFLTFGIALGSWWAYRELGWGGWWFWDPVENASFLPWLSGTALIHSLAVTEKRGAFRSWTVLLAILTFALILLGAFIVRSGVITSVHAFATDPERGVYILGFLAFSVGVSLFLYAWRAPAVGLGGGFSPWSRESLLLANNVLLVVATAAVLLGTVYPLAMDAFGRGKISVGPPYFETVFYPLMLPLLLLLVFGPMVPWKKGRPRQTLMRLKWVLAAAAAGAALWPLAMSAWSPYVFASVFAALAIVGAVAADLYRRLRGRNADAAVVRPPPFRASLIGMHLAHAGLAVFVIGVAMVMAYEVEKDVRLAPGEAVEFSGYRFVFDGVEDRRGPNYLAERGTMRIERNGRPYTVLFPEKRQYDRARGMPMTKASLDSGFFRDLYVSLGDPVGEGAWVLRVYYKPFMNWLWLGCLMMAVGGLIAICDRRYRIGMDKA